MPEEVKETEKVENSVFVNPFFVGKVPAPVAQKDEDPFVIRYKGLEYDEETKGAKPVYEKVNLVEEIQQCKDLCGLEYLKRQLATGQAVPSDFYDDGKGGVDLTTIPADPGAARKAADKINDDMAALCKELGLDASDSVSAAKLEKLVAAEVEKRYQAEIAAKETKND